MRRLLRLRCAGWCSRGLGLPALPRRRRRLGRPARPRWSAARPRRSRVATPVRRGTGPCRPGSPEATFTLYGAKGGAGSDSYGAGGGGQGAEVTGTLPVTPGTVLQVNVGQAGVTEPGAAFGGGGPSGGGGGGGGGGASDIRDGADKLAGRLLVAGRGRRRRGGRHGYYRPVSLRAALAGMLTRRVEQAHPLSASCSETLSGGGGGGAGTATMGGAGGAGSAFRRLLRTEIAPRLTVPRAARAPAGPAAAYGRRRGRRLLRRRGRRRPGSRTSRAPPPAAGAGAAVPAIPVPRPARR